MGQHEVHLLAQVDCSSGYLLCARLQKTELWLEIVFFAAGAQEFAIWGLKALYQHIFLSIYEFSFIDSPWRTCKRWIKLASQRMCEFYNFDHFESRTVLMLSIVALDLLAYGNLTVGRKRMISSFSWFFRVWAKGVFSFCWGTVLKF